MMPPCATELYSSDSIPGSAHSDPVSVEVNSALKDITILLPNQSQHSSHLALDFGGSLIKLVYLSPTNEKSFLKGNLEGFDDDKSFHILGGRIHFVKFDTREIHECLDFIYSNQLHCDAFTHNEGQMKYVQIDQNDLFPYLLVNIGSGVSVIKVDGVGKYERVGGTSIGGGTFCGLGRLLTKCKSFDELLEASRGGDNKNVDMLVGDIYGRDYAKIGLSASTTASSFGKVISESKDLDDYRPEDISLSLLRMISYHIGQLAHSKACEYGLKRIFFGGFFIRGHAYTMDTISLAVQYWSKGNIEAMFLRHEGFLGALGVLMSYDTLNGPLGGYSNDKASI
ncbi:pantothenate kinase [Ranunculus cassubicifolius]